MTAWTPQECAFMDHALALAQAQLGRTAPNPAVGCVLAQADAIIAAAATGDGGRPHAEEKALQAAGARAAGASAYVTLEPCARRSSGVASCTDRLIAAHVARVIIACRDPHPNAAGVGVRRLADAGVRVREGLRRDEAETLNAGFFHRVRSGRPLVRADVSVTGYDATLEADPAEDLLALLEALGRRGMTRVRVAPGSALCVALDAAGLLDPP